MNLSDFPLLSVLLWLPALGALGLLLLPQGLATLYRWVALTSTLITFGVAGLLAYLFASGPYGRIGAEVAVPLPMQFVESHVWVSEWGISYLLGVDGVSIWLLALTAFLAPIAVIASWRLFAQRTRPALLLLLLLETAALGVFMAQDLLLFYMFWELSLIFAVFLLGVWGGYRRVAAATRLFVYTIAGSLLMLVGIIAVFILHRNAINVVDPAYVGTFDLTTIAFDIQTGLLRLDPATERVLFGLFFAAFAIKSAVWPFHSWLPLAYSEAPTPVAIMLSGVMSKLGAYGFIRICLTLFPETARWAAPAIGILAVIGMLYAAAVAFAQTDIQGLVAYSSISHMNFVVLGIFALNVEGIGGALFLMVSHGVTVAALFLLVAALYERRNIRELASFGGIWQVMPVAGGLTLLAMFASIGLPGLSGFIGEFIIMQGVFTSPVLGWPFALAAAAAVVLAAIYGLKLFRAIFSGPLTITANYELQDLTRRERLAMAVVLVPVVVGGLFPNLLLTPLQGGAASVVRYLSPIIGG